MNDLLCWFESALGAEGHRSNPVAPTQENPSGEAASGDPEGFFVLMRAAVDPLPFACFRRVFLPIFLHLVCPGGCSESSFVESRSRVHWSTEGMRAAYELLGVIESYARLFSVYRYPLCRPVAMPRATTVARRWTGNRSCSLAR